MMRISDPYTGVRDIWAPTQMSVWSGSVELEAAAAGVQPEDAQSRVLCEYKGPPQPLQVLVQVQGAPLLASPGEFTGWERGGRLTWDNGFSRFASDVRSGVYQVPGTHFFRLSVKRYNRSATSNDTSPAARVRAAVLPGVAAPGAEHVLTGVATIAATASADFDYLSSLYRSFQLAIDGDPGADRQLRVSSSESLLYIDQLVPYRFPAFPRVDIPGVDPARGTVLTASNLSASLSTTVTMQAFSG